MSTTTPATATPSATDSGDLRERVRAHYAAAAASVADGDDGCCGTCTVTVDPPQPVQITFGRQDGLGQTRVHTSEKVAGVHEVPGIQILGKVDPVGAGVTRNPGRGGRIRPWPG